MAHSSAFIKDYWPESLEGFFKSFGAATLGVSIFHLYVWKYYTRQSTEINNRAASQVFFASSVSFCNRPGTGDPRVRKIPKSDDRFWVIWRSVRRTTGGIDSRYRDLMEKGDSRLGIKPFSRRTVLKSQSGKAYEYCPDPNSNNLIEILRDNLASHAPKIRSKADWIQYAKEMPFYDTTIPTAITRLIFLRCEPRYSDFCSSTRFS